MAPGQLGARAPHQLERPLPSPCRQASSLLGIGDQPLDPGQPAGVLVIQEQPIDAVPHEAPVRGPVGVKPEG